MIKLIHDNENYAMWMKISVGLGAVACVALLASGIGLLALQPWARALSIGYGIFALVQCLVGTVINYIYLFQPLMEQAQQKQGPESAAALGGAIGGMIGGCIGAVYPILLIIFMLRRNVIEAFRRQQTLISVKSQGRKSCKTLVFRALAPAKDGFGRSGLPPNFHKTMSDNLKDQC